MNNSTFSIDLTALYESLENNKTYYGYYIDHTEDNDNTWNDLRQDCPNTLFACDGEECKVLCEFIDCVSVYNSDNIPFWLSKEEFDIVCH